MERCFSHMASQVWKASDFIRVIAFYIFRMTANPLVRISFWSALVGRFISSTQTVGTGQTGMQRYVSLPTMRKGQWLVESNNHPGLREKHLKSCSPNYVIMRTYFRYAIIYTRVYMIQQKNIYTESSVYAPNTVDSHRSPWAIILVKFY